MIPRVSYDLEGGMLYVYKMRRNLERVLPAIGGCEFNIKPSYTMGNVKRKILKIYCKAVKDVKKLNIFKNGNLVDRIFKDGEGKFEDSVRIIKE